MSSLLRLGAIAGSLTVFLKAVFLSTELQINQYYGFYSFALIAVGVGLICLVFLRSSSQDLLRNPDLLVPVGLYVAAQWGLGVTYTWTFFDIQNGTIDFKWLTLSFVIGIVWQIAVWTIFVGWLTRMIVQLVQEGKVDLITAFQGIAAWFPRVLCVIVLVPVIPIGLMVALFLLLSFDISRLEYVIWPFVIIVGFCTLIVNIATSVLLPHVASTQTALMEAIREGICLSWSYKSRLIFPLFLGMVLSGWIVFISVSYKVQSDENVEFGEWSKYRNESEKKEWKFAANFVWIPGYPSENKWNKELYGILKQESPPSIDLRILILGLLASLAINLHMIRSVWAKEFVIANNFPESVGKYSFRLVPFWISALLLVVPIEYAEGSIFLSPIAEGKDPIRELQVPYLYLNNDSFEKSLLFEVGRQGIVDFAQNDQAADEFPVGIINDVYFDKNKDEIVLSGSENAVVLDLQGNVKRKVVFDLGTSSDTVSPDAHFTEVKAVDVDKDGSIEFLGYGSYPYTAFLLNQRGSVVWKLARDGIDIRKVDAKDIDSDGKNEMLLSTKSDVTIFDLKGAKKFSRDFPGSVFDGVEFLDVDGDGTIEVLNSAFLNSYFLSLKEGAEKNSIGKPYEVKGILEESPRPSIVFFADNCMGLFDFDGNLLAKYQAPLSEIKGNGNSSSDELLYDGKSASVFKANSAKVKFKKDMPEFLAVAATISSRLPDLSFVTMIYIYNSNGELIYQESISDSQDLLKAIPNDDGTESLVVGERGKVWILRAH